MKKRMMIMLMIVGILFGAIFGFKFFKQQMISHYIKNSLTSAVVTISANKASYAVWQPTLTVSGSVRAIEGVDVTTQLGGMVQTIYFTPGSFTHKGDLLVQLNIDPDVAQLHVLQANEQLAKVTYNRDKAQYAIQAVSKQQLDTDIANLQSATAQVAEQNAVIEQKTIRAPFSGRLGICIVSPGQYINPGNKIVMLQTIDPIYVDFYIPQNNVPLLKKGLAVTANSNAFPKITLSGKITTIDPGLDPNVRNVKAEATFENPQGLLTPGMFVTVAISTGEPQQKLTLPQTAISFNPYGSIVYVITKSEKNGESKLVAHQRFVKTGESRGDQIAILQGVKPGDLIVTSGQIKLKNGSVVQINNSTEPLDNPNPHPRDE